MELLAIMTICGISGHAQDFETINQLPEDAQQLVRRFQTGQISERDLHRMSDAALNRVHVD